MTADENTKRIKNRISELMRRKDVMIYAIWDQEHSMWLAKADFTRPFDEDATAEGATLKEALTALAEKLAS